MEYKIMVIGAAMLTSGVNSEYVQQTPYVHQVVTQQTTGNQFLDMMNTMMMPLDVVVSYLPKPVRQINYNQNFNVTSQVLGITRAQQDIKSSNIYNQSRSCFVKKGKYPRIKKAPKLSLVRKVHGTIHFRDENVQRNIVESKRGLRF